MLFRRFFVSAFLLSTVVGCSNQREEQTTETTVQQHFKKREVPAVHSKIRTGSNGRLSIEVDGVEYPEKGPEYLWTAENTQLLFESSANGLDFQMLDTDFEGILYYGFIPFEDQRFHQTVFFKSTAAIHSGKGHIPIVEMKGKYDMVNWQEKGSGLIGYRLVNKDGEMVTNGRFAFSGPDPFQKEPTITEGPLLHCLGPDSVIISMKVDRPDPIRLIIDDMVYSDSGRTRYEFVVRGLKPNKKYRYQVELGIMAIEYDMHTAPDKGDRSAFTFAYASDGRHSKGGGERKIHGTNAYIMKKIAALALQQGSKFIQFTGDLINGYESNRGNMELQFRNWVQSVESFWHYAPFNIGMGNHETLLYQFNYPPYANGLSVDQFPYKTQSSEKLFADHFVNPLNGPESEDGTAYDPDPDAQDFPSYRENVYSYHYGNIAMIVLNTDYWYSPSLKSAFQLGIPAQHDGGLHGYIMDRQLEWLQQEIERMETDPEIDHIFVTAHTPFFPNGGHVKDDMWYHGNNEARPYVAGKGLEKGIIERRDELLDLLINRSTKVRALLTGDEHNYCRTRIDPAMPKYPEEWTGTELVLTRSIWQINNGAAGAPYYGREEVPWSEYTYSFSTQNALVLIDVHGKEISVRVVNPDTLEPIDEFRLH